MRYVYNKLVRDKIPEKINSDENKSCKYRILSDEEYIAELNKKVIEEAQEFIQENSIEELGDLMEVISTIMKVKKIDIEQVKTAMSKKSEKRGKFENKIFLEYVDEEMEKEI